MREEVVLEDLVVVVDVLAAVWMGGCSEGVDPVGSAGVLVVDPVVRPRLKDSVTLFLGCGEEIAALMLLEMVAVLDTFRSPFFNVTVLGWSVTLSPFDGLESC